MVAAQVFISLCVASLAVAAPQFNLPDLRSVNTFSSNVNEEQVVTSVVSALGPSISQAVADALASLEAAAAAEAAAAEEAARLVAEQRAAEEAARLAAEQRAAEEAARRAAEQRAAAEQAARQRAAAEQAARQRAAADQAARQRAAAEQAARQRAAAEQAARERAASAAAKAAANPTARPVYNFEYKVADNDAQTYISQSEERDGQSLSGTYSFVNPLGSLVTVNYQAGPEGYTQTSSEQAGFVSIRAQPVRSNAAAEEATRIAAEQAAAQQRAELARVAAEQRAAAEAARFAAEQRAAEEAARLAAEQRATEEAARLAAEQAASQQALISRIISSIQPQISYAVQSAITTTQTVAVPAPIAPVAPIAPLVSTGDLSSTFGSGFSVKIDTPEFNIAY